MEQLGNLLAAMIAVILNGQSDLTVMPQKENVAPADLPKPAYGYYARAGHALPPEILHEFQRGGKYFGALAFVARKLGVYRQTVEKVAHGKAQSRRILAAIQDRLIEIDREASLDSAGLKPELLAEFLTGGRYVGLQRLVATRCRVSPTYVSKIAHGVYENDGIMEQLRAEMAQVDAKIAAKNGVPE
jgi:hypothetical protein